MQCVKICQIILLPLILNTVRENYHSRECNANKERNISIQNAKLKVRKRFYIFQRVHENINCTKETRKIHKP